MKIYKGQYGYSTSAHSKNKDGSTIKYYINVNFKKGTEPGDVLEGNLIFKDKLGNERPCFLTSYLSSKNEVMPKLVIMGGDGEQTKMFGSSPKLNGEDIDLPFM